MLRTPTMISITALITTSLLAGTAIAQQPQHVALPVSAPGEFVHQGVARDSQRYENQLKALYSGPAEAFQAQGKKARDIRVAADKLLGSDPRAAMRQYATVVVLEASDAEGWLGLARAALTVEVDASNGAERYQHNLDASAAAYIAAERSRGADAKARALAVLGEALKRRSFWRPAIDAIKLSLSLADKPEVRKVYELLLAEHGFRMLDYKVENESAAPRVCLQFSERLRGAGADLGKFISLDGHETDAISGEGRQLCVDGLAHGKRYEIALRAGLPSDIGEMLVKNVVIPVYVRDRAPLVRFSGKNYVLPSRGQQGIPVVSVNTRRVGIEIYRVGDRNLNAVVGGNGDFMKQISGSDPGSLGSEQGQKVYAGDLEVSSKLNEEVVTAVPVGEAIPELKPGVYAMVAVPKSGDRPADAASGERASETESTSANSATQWFIVSDLGLTAFTGDNGLHAFVRSLVSTEPFVGATVKLVARNNEILATAKTDGSGYVRFEPGLARGEGGLKPSILVAETAGGQYAFLDLSAAAFDLSDRGVKGRPQPAALDAFLYTDRGVYRPGETVHLDSLVRDRQGHASTVPMTLVLTRPDGVEHSRLALTDQGLGGREHNLALTGTAMTGTWRAKIYADPKSDPLATAAFLVEDFVPERLALDLKPATPSLQPEVAGTINVAGRYLYGPPAAGLAAEAEVVVKAASRQPDGFAGYHFGLADEKITPVRKSLEQVPVTDAKGELPLEVLLPAIPRTAKPLSADVIVRLREPGGRTIERSVTLPVDPRLQRIGVKPMFADDRVAEGEPAGFDVVLLDEAGRRMGGKRLVWTLYKLESSWQWYRRDDSWTYDSVTLTHKVGNGQIDSQTDIPSRITTPTGSGRYRLEVASAEVAGSGSGPSVATTSLVFDAGWYGGEAADTPEMLEVGLDKPSYRAGDTARLKVATRNGGKLLVTVLGSGLLTQKAVDLPNGGGEVAIPVGADWGAGAYVTATLYRPMDEKAKRMPTRAIGLKYLGLDQSDRTLKVTLSAPAKVGSGGHLAVPVKIDGLARGEEARITLAAVDVGILNLTRFETPAPEAWFQSQALLGTEIRDLYGRLIDGMHAERGKLRSGGDEGGVATTGSPPVEAMLALHSGIVRVGPDGTASVDFALPDFNGTVRLMAVAWSEGRIGHGSEDVIVRDPIALTASAPRFLTLGDEARLDLSLHNVEGAAGNYKLTVEQDDAEHGGRHVPVVAREVALAVEQRRSERLVLKPTAIGSAGYDVHVTGPGGIDVKRHLTFDVKVPGGDIKHVTVAKLEPKTGKLTVSKDLIADMLPGRTSVNVSVGPLASFDVPGLLSQLDRYPYGCAEQTTSRALPLLYANELSVKLGLRSDGELKSRVEGAIARVLEMQDNAGAFGIWGPHDGDMWLTAYVTDFLTRAKEAGFTVKPLAFTAALDRLQSFVSYAQDFEKGGEDRAYALYVLARNGRAPIGELRYYADTRLDRFSTTLARAQIGAALAMLGDRERAEKAFRAALGHGEGKSTGWRHDYGSGLRDNAGLVTLASETSVMKGEAPRLAGVIAKAFSERAFTSTQEQAWMLLAAKAMSDTAKSVALTVNGVPQTGAYTRRMTGEELKGADLVIGNDGDTATDAVVSVIGAALTPEPAVEKGFKIERSYYTLDGKPVDMKSASGGEGRIAQNERLVVVVKVEARDKGGRVLVVDRLPAGLEIENPRLVESADQKSLEWLKTSGKPEHAEFRDDRFVAAFNFSRSGDSSDNSEDGDDEAKKGPVSTATVAYMVRAVTPGVFVHPAATVEDMYRPERYARTATGKLEVVAK